MRGSEFQHIVKNSVRNSVKTHSFFQPRWRIEHSQTRRYDYYVVKFQNTQPGDPLRLDYGYRNGAQGYIQAVALGRDTAQAKVLAYTAERIRARIPDVEFTAITEIEPARENPRHQFMVKLFEEQRIAVVPLNRVERFAEDLRARLQ